MDAFMMSSHHYVHRLPSLLRTLPVATLAVAAAQGVCLVYHELQILC